MSYRPHNQYNHLRTDHFILGENGAYDGDLLVFKGNITLKRGAWFNHELKMIDSTCKVVMEESSGISHLHFMNDGHLYLKGKCIILEIMIEGNVTLHVSRSLPDWQVCFQHCDMHVGGFEHIVFEDD